MLNNQNKAPELIEDLGMQYPLPSSKTKRRFGIYKCHCGKEFKTQVQSVKRRNTTSCGCYNMEQIKKRQTKHGYCNHRLYNIWKNMIFRVSKKNKEGYSSYAAKGIIICERWKDFSNFVEDMDSSYKKGLSIDRIDNDGNYKPDNCRWTTSSIQARNTRIIFKHNTSGYRGVYYNKIKKKWTAQIKVNSKTINLGSFIDKKQAAICRDSYIIANNLEHTLNGVL